MSFPNHQWNRDYTFILFHNKSDIREWKRFCLLTALMRESNTLTANAVPHANGCVRYSSVSGSSSSSWSKNWTFESFTENNNKNQIIRCFWVTSMWPYTLHSQKEKETAYVWKHRLVSLTSLKMKSRWMWKCAFKNLLIIILLVRSDSLVLRKWLPLCHKSSFVAPTACTQNEIHDVLLYIETILVLVEYSG